MKEANLDFYMPSVKETKDGRSHLYPDWIVGRSNDLMVRGRSFYAIWDEEAGLWSTDEYDVQRLVDDELERYNKSKNNIYDIKRMRSFNTQIWSSFRKFIQNVSDNSHSLDEKLTFANTEVKKSDYVSRRLPYSLVDGAYEAWDELVSVLYSQEERDKIEWAIGAVVAGDAKDIQKFLVFYGPAGSGKSTILNIIQQLFYGYTVMFDAKALGSGNGAFSTEVFRSNPLVAIQHDGDLSRIDDNTKLNSIISHEDMTMNEKYKSSYSAKVNAFLFMGTNQPVKISDAKSGIIRRLIDVHPTGATIAIDRYHILMDQIQFELGAIAYHCQERYLQMGKNYYNGYRPLEMMLQTDVFYNYIEYVYDILKAQNGITLKQAYQLYKEFGEETGIDKLLPQYKFREELRNYFHNFHDREIIEGVTVRSYYSGFKSLTPPDPFIPDDAYSIVLEKFESAFDTLCADQPAQYAKKTGTPELKWENVTTKLNDIDTSKLHYVLVPREHIVFDFDLVDEDGNKDMEKNIAEASKLPPTYTEVSKSGGGLHLHYIYTGDVSQLSRVYDVGVEIKTLLGGESLRRKLTLCNNLEVATLTSGLPIKDKPVIENKVIKSEKGIRELIERNLRKEIHPGTKPSVDFIKKILDDAYTSGVSYDVRDMRGVILSFAAKSSNQSEIAVKTVKQMQFVSEDNIFDTEKIPDAPIVFFDVEVYKNLFVICWKKQGNKKVVKMINPTPADIEPLFKLKLVGFNNRRYDNHILYARFLGYSNEELFDLSQKIINGDKGNSPLFGAAYDLSYADIYDFSSKKQSLKKFQIELGIYHMEMDHEWDQPVPEDKWEKVTAYCENDVIATEAVFEDRRQDFVAREILSELSGLSVNHTTQQHTAKIIFGDDKTPQNKFEYTDLSTEFSGYKFNGKESTYRGEITGEGGYVYAEPGIYEKVTVLDVASMHPTSIECLNLFGPYTKRYSELKEARMAIKRKNYQAARELLDGKLSKFINSHENGDTGAEELAYALKIVINIVYGLTSARFPNVFRDNRNVDNIVAKRGALFMIDLKHFVQDEGFQVIHIKTDSIKIPKATTEIIDKIIEFGKRYGYDFELEATYDKFCLVNDAVYIARTINLNYETDPDNVWKRKWVAVGAQFQHPYVYKTLFTQEPLVFDDLCQTKSVVQGVMYLEFEGDDHLVHVGRTGSFVPVRENGGILWRIKDGKKYAVSGTKNYRWVEREMAAYRGINLSNWHDTVDVSYFEDLTEEAISAINNFGSFDSFVA